MVEQKECERLGLRVEKRKNGENHDRVVVEKIRTGFCIRVGPGVERWCPSEESHPQTL